jgi:hypothetical protein
VLCALLLCQKYIPECLVRLLRLLRVLLRHGAPLEARCKEGYTAAALAAKSGFNSALVLLHGEGLDADHLRLHKTQHKCEFQGGMY